MTPLVSLFVFTVATVNLIEAFNVFNQVDYTPKNVGNLSSLCQQQYNASDLLTKLQMFDASVKIPVGVGYLNFYHLGDFDECYSVETKTSIGTINGKYCFGNVPFTNTNLTDIAIEPRMLGNNPESVGLHLGYCIPNACTADDVEFMTFGTVKFDEQYCQSKATEPELSSGAIATITILAIFFAIAVVSTIYDVFVYYLEKKPLHELLVSFSVFTNGKKLISASTNPDQLLCLNGMRALSMMWVIIAHIYSLTTMGPLGSFVEALKFQDDAKNMFIIGGSVSVDTFFAAGGLVTVYTFLKAADKGVKFNIFMYYIHRYLRLTPILAIVVLMHANLLNYLGNGPMWNIVNNELVKNCEKHWWSALLYIQNFTNAGDNCVPQSWYLSVDFQIFLLSPIVLLPLKWKPKVGLSILAVLIGAGILIPFVIGYVFEIQAYLFSLDADQSKTQEMMSKYYMQPHTRFGPYVIGMLTGYFIYILKKNNTKIVINPIVNLMIWFVSTAGLVACVYSYHDHMKYDRWSHSLSLAFLRNAWGLCVCAVVFLCVFGYGGIVNWFLSLPVFQFLTKLSYSMYLTHYALIIMRYASSKHNYEFSYKYYFWSFWGDFMFTLALSFILCLMFESPVVILEKHIFRTGGRNTKKAATEVAKIASIS